jgi:hypothetical protein
MFGRLTRGTILIAAGTVTCALAMPGTVRAANGDGGQTGTSTDGNAGTVTASAAQDLTGGLTSSNTTPSKPRCVWEKYTPAPNVPVDPDGALSSLLAQAAASDATVYTKTCPLDVGTETTLALVQNQVSIADLMSSASKQVTAEVPVPAMNMNPKPAVGGMVNIGLWLAVADPGQVSITASVGPVWATVTARYVSTTWNFGNGDSVTCDGLGTPIVDVNTAAQGPCGYTYRWPSAPKFTGTDDLNYHASATGHWAVTYATSTGTTGSLGPIDRTTKFNYRVREIQTVRVADDG